MTTPARLLGDAIHQAPLSRGWSQADLLRALGGQRTTAALWSWQNGNGIGIDALLEVIGAMPEVGDQVVMLIRQAQHRRGAQPQP
jgi:hypothetical protein